MSTGQDALVRADAAARLAAQRELVRPFVLEAGAGTGKTAALVARVLAWSLGEGWAKAEAALATLGASDGGAFASRYHEVRGDAYYAKGDKAAALSEYRSAQGSNSGGSTPLLDLKIAELSAATPPPPTSANRAPSLAKALVMAAPIPFAGPVITATRPLICKSMVVFVVALASLGAAVVRSFDRKKRTPSNAPRTASSPNPPAAAGTPA